MSTADRAVHTLEAAATALEREAIPQGGEAADLLGRVRQVEVRLADYRRAVLAEETDAEGEHYAIAVEQKGVRSYNDASILGTVMAAGHDLRDLIAAGAVKLTWKWTALEHFFRKEDLELRIVGHEIENDGDVEAPHVGSYWKPYTRIVPRERS